MTRDEHLQQAMAHELEIVWLEELDDIDYVRQGAYLLWTRRQPLVYVGGARQESGLASWPEWFA